MVFVSKSRWNAGKWKIDTVITQKIKMLGPKQCDPKP